MQLTIISEKLGKLPEKHLDFVTSEKAKRFMRKLPNRSAPSASSLFPRTPRDAQDSILSMLRIHPEKRATCEQALSHRFFNQLHSDADEPLAESKFDFSFEQEKLKRLRLKELIWQEVGSFRPGCLPVAPRRNGSNLHDI